MHSEALALNRELGHRRAQADDLDLLGRLALVQGDYPAARAFSAESLEIRRELNDRWGVALTLDDPHPPMVAGSVSGAWQVKFSHT